MKLSIMRLQHWRASLVTPRALSLRHPVCVSNERKQFNKTVNNYVTEKYGI